MKKLVKTAKQQFAERLETLCGVKKNPFDGDEVFYTATENDGRFVLLYQNDEGYYETTYDMAYVDLVLSEKFLSEMAYRFIDINRDIQPLFKWYAEFKYALSGKEPFDLLDVWMTEIGKLKTYNDIYEEVPDLISAKEQWEKDSSDAIECYNGVEGICKYLMDANNLTFFVSFNGEYRKYQPIALSELRKDSAFIAKYINVVNTLHPQDMNEALKWISTGEYTMSDTSMMDIYEALPKDTQVVTYQDNWPICEIVQLTPEQQEAVKMIEDAINLLHERGGKLVCYSWSEEWYAVNGKGIMYKSLNGEDKTGFVDVSDIVEKQPVNIPTDVYWSDDSSLLAKMV